MVNGWVDPFRFSWECSHEHEIRSIIADRLTIFAIALAIAHPANADFIDQEMASFSWNPGAGSQLTIDDVALSEGDATTNFTLPSPQPRRSTDIVVDYTTADNTATAWGLHHHHRHADLVHEQ
jgi:hypothetical protein